MSDLAGLSEISLVFRAESRRVTGDFRQHYLPRLLNQMQASLQTDFATAFGLVADYYLVPRLTGTSVGGNPWPIGFSRLGSENGTCSRC